MTKEQNKPIAAEVLTDKELDGVVGGKENAADPGPERTRKFWTELAGPELACLK